MYIKIQDYIEYNKTNKIIKINISKSMKYWSPFINILTPEVLPVEKDKIQFIIRIETRIRI